MEYSSIRDNHSHGTVGDFLKEVIKVDSEVSIVSAYFTIYAYHRLRENLDGVKRLRFLFGEPTFIKSIDPEKNNTRSYKLDEENHLVIPVDARLSQKRTAADCADWIKEKVDIRSMVKPNFLHGKLYHIKQSTGIEKAVSGSSNFTVNGLGLGGSKNIELNIITDSDRDRNELISWFDSIWDDNTGLVEDVKEEVLKYLEQLYTDNDPEFIYFKTLYHIFEKYIEDQGELGLIEEHTGFFETEIWNALYDFQKDGVKGAINKISRFNGCIIADSVGLGKTYEALAVIKYFELLNQRVLLICPKKLSGNWTIYQAGQNHILNPFKKDRFNFSVIYHTDIGRAAGCSKANNINLETFNWGAYDLVVIDESHNFRGNPLERTGTDGSTKMNRAKWLMERIIKSGAKTRILMLTATPVNNNLRDLRNQISFITEGRDNALMDSCSIRSIENTLVTAQRHFTQWATSKDRSKKVSDLIGKLDTSFIKLLDSYSIARSRKHIKKYYNFGTERGFPERHQPPLSIYSDIDIKKRFPSYDRINKQITEYKLSIFNPSKYVKAEKRDKYIALAASSGGFKFSQEDREDYLIGMMKMNFLKRLESSIESFEISLDRTIKKIEDLEKMIDAFKKSGSGVVESDYIDPDEIDSDEFDEEVTEEWLVGKKLKFELEDLDTDSWLDDLSKDKDALVGLLNNAEAVTPERDAKLLKLMSLIKDKVENPTNNYNRKVLIFTAFADTAEYLYKNLKQFLSKDLNIHSALVTGTRTETTCGRNDYDSILVNFSPVSKNRSSLESLDQSSEINVLIATDCISEGQNLQDCDYLINYDIHWNPVRIIQRFGRIDRLGSINKTVYLVNFWPTEDLENYINLKSRVEARMALVDVTATGEDNLLDSNISDLVDEDLKFRNRQLLRLKDEVLDLEELDESVSLTDFTLDDFRIELMNYMDNNKKKMKETPMGLYAVVPAPGGEHLSILSDRAFTPAEKEIIKPGVIFCLAQHGEFDCGDSVNVLNPYFLVYIRNDGTVRYNYTNSKQILEIFRLLCQGQKTPYEKLCSLFNHETDNGASMEKYDSLLGKAVKEIVSVFRKKTSMKLTSDRSAIVIPKEKQANDMNDFELITWLIVR